MQPDITDVKKAAKAAFFTFDLLCYVYNDNKLFGFYRRRFIATEVDL